MNHKPKGSMIRRPEVLGCVTVILCFIIPVPSTNQNLVFIWIISSTGNVCKTVNKQKDHCHTQQLMKRNTNLILHQLLHLPVSAVQYLVNKNGTYITVLIRPYICCHSGAIPSIINLIKRWSLQLVEKDFMFLALPF